MCWVYRYLGHNRDVNIFGGENKMNKDINALDEQAEREGIAISNAFKPHTMDFGKRQDSRMRLNNQISNVPKAIKHRYVWKTITLLVL